MPLEQKILEIPPKQKLEHLLGSGGYWGQELNLYKIKSLI